VVVENDTGNVIHVGKPAFPTDQRVATWMKEVLNEGPMSWLRDLPEALRVAAYYADEEAAWPAREAIDVIGWLTALGVLVMGVEVWLPTTPGPTIPTPYVYVWEAEEDSAGGSSNDYVARVNAGAAEYILRFAWDPRDKAHLGMEPYFNLTV
jgi:hypothetical protein